jgi:hypothetical protein
VPPISRRQARKGAGDPPAGRFVAAGQDYRRRAEGARRWISSGDEHGTRRLDDDDPRQLPQALFSLGTLALRRGGLPILPRPDRGVVNSFSIRAVCRTEAEGYTISEVAGLDESRNTSSRI